MEQEIRFCTTSDGVRIAYATVGDGPPVIFVPGWVSHLEVQWDNPQERSAVEALAEHVHYVRFDKRGTGLSDRDVTDFSVDARVRDLEAVADRLKLRSFALMGYSEGGPVAIAYAVRHPSRVSRLILYGTYSRANLTEEVRETLEALLKLIRAEWGIGSETLTNLFMPGASPEQAQFFVKIQREGAHGEDAAAMLEANAEADVFELLPKIRARTLVVHTKGDRVAPFEAGRELASRIPDARFVMLEGDRHVPGPEAAAQLHGLVVDFCWRTRPRRRDR